MQKMTLLASLVISLQYIVACGTSPQSDRQAEVLDQTYGIAPVSPSPLEDCPSILMSQPLDFSNDQEDETNEAGAFMLTDGFRATCVNAEGMVTQHLVDKIRPLFGARRGQQALDFLMSQVDSNSNGSVSLVELRSYLNSVGGFWADLIPDLRNNSNANGIFFLTDSQLQSRVASGIFDNYRGQDQVITSTEASAIIQALNLQ